MSPVRGNYKSKYRRKSELIRIGQLYLRNIFGYAAGISWSATIFSPRHKCRSVPVKLAVKGRGCSSLDGSMDATIDQSTKRNECSRQEALSEINAGGRGIL
jgi:hypothetical protein